MISASVAPQILEGCPSVALCIAQALLVYDVADRGSFDELERWIKEAADFGAGGIPVAVCANKVSASHFLLHCATSWHD